ncbi:MAG: GLUG motif-containing protein [Alphaproteobacteria bacterium]
MGALVGKLLNSTVDNCYTTGSIYGNFHLGLIAGYAEASVIKNSYSKGSITGDDYLGGIVGRGNNTSISKCYATGNIISSRGSGDDWAGGLAGKIQNSSSVTNCYTTGKVTGHNHIGGLIGRVESSSVINSYAVGAVSGSSSVGGLIGSASSLTSSFSYWDKQTTGMTSSAGGIGKTTAEMKVQSTFSGWDFENVWCMPPSSYPVFQGNSACVTCSGCAVLSGGVCIPGSSCSGEHPNCIVSNNNGVCECSADSCNAGRSCSGTGTCIDCDASESCGSCGCGTSQKPTGTGTCMNNSVCCIGECNMATGANSCSYSDDLCPSGVACNRSTLSCCSSVLPYWRSSNCKACSSTSGLSGICQTKGMMCNSNYDCVSCAVNMQCTCDDGFVSDGSGNCVEPLCESDGECGVDKCINAGQYNAFCSNCSSTNKVWVSGSCESCPSGSTYHNGVCLCSDGKLWNSASNTCAKKSLISTKGVIDTKSKTTSETPESRYNRIKRKMNRITNSAYAGVAGKEEGEN